MLKLTRCKVTNCDSIVVIKCRRCEGVDIHISQNYAPKSDVKRLRCRCCDHTWDVIEDSHTGYEEIR